MQPSRAHFRALCLCRCDCPDQKTINTTWPGVPALPDDLVSNYGVEMAGEFLVQRPQDGVTGETAAIFPTASDYHLVCLQHDGSAGGWLCPGAAHTGCEQSDWGRHLPAAQGLSSVAQLVSASQHGLSFEGIEPSWDRVCLQHKGSNCGWRCIILAGGAHGVAAGVQGQGLSRWLAGVCILASVLQAMFLQ